MRFCLAGSGPVGARPLGGFWDCTIMGTAEGPSACGQPSGLDVGYFQRIELVDGDGSSRFEKLAVDFDEGPISWLALCIMIIRLANQKPTVGHRSWYHVIQLCVVSFLSCFFHIVVFSIFVPDRTPSTAAGRWRRAWDHSSCSTIMSPAARPASNALISFAAIAWSLCGR